MNSQESQKQRYKHIVWIIENRPDYKNGELISFYLMLHQNVDPGYAEAKDLWLEKTEKYKNNPQVLRNAADFFALYDKNLSQELQVKANVLDPENPIIREIKTMR